MLCVCVFVCVRTCMHVCMCDAKMLMLYEYIFSYVATFTFLSSAIYLWVFNSGTKGLIADVYVLTECAFMSHI